MMISTKGRYALRVMAELAGAWREENPPFVPLKEITTKHGISQKYLESIMTVLSKHEFVEGLHGKGGGYRLTREPKAYQVGEILRLTEGTLAPVACLECEENTCERKDSCKTLPLWKGLDEAINSYLGSVTLADLIA